MSTILFTIILIYLGTFIGCNDKLQGDYKSGFFVVAGILTVLFIFFSAILG